jgi:hypothetical protein
MHQLPANRASSINLWTLGHRRFYSPSIRVAGGLSPPGAAQRHQLRDDPELRREPNSASDRTVEHAALSEKYHHVF